MKQEEFDKELERLRSKRDKDNKYLNALREAQENAEEHSEMDDAIIVQWENSCTINERNITIHRQEFRISQLEEQLNS